VGTNGIRVVLLMSAPSDVFAHFFRFCSGFEKIIIKAFLFLQEVQFFLEDHGKDQNMTGPI